MKDDVTVSCPVCGEEIDMGEGVYKGDVISCPECYAELEVVRLDPPKVREAKEGDEEETEDKVDEDISDDEDEYSA